VNPQYEAHERLCKSIGDMAKENEDLKQHNNDLERRLLALWEKYHTDSNYCIDRIKHLEDIINRAHLAFFSDSSDRKVSISMHRILDEEVRKESQ